MRRQKEKNDLSPNPLISVDIGLSDIANLTRCKQAALEWAEKHLATEHRNLSVAQHSGFNERDVSGSALAPQIQRRSMG
jgi:hypothetical protein